MEKNLYDLTTPQKSILLTEEFYKGSNINNICMTEIIENFVDFDILKKSIYLFIENNPSFNMKLILHENTVKQYLDNNCNFDIEIIDIPTLEDISIIEKELSSKVYTIFNSRLFDFKIFRLPNQHGGFVINIHHLYGDSWTLGILAREVIRIYSDLINGNTPQFNKDFSYLNYIDSEQAYIKSDKFLHSKMYWNKVFSEIPEVATIPNINSNNSNSISCKANRKTFLIDKNYLQIIRSYCKNHKISLYNFFISLYSIYLSRVSQLEDFVIGTPILNRTNFNEKNTTGMFVNTCPLKIHYDADSTFTDFLKNVSISSFLMLKHQKYSYQYILDDLRIKNPSLPNLYRFLLSYQVTKSGFHDGLIYHTRWNFNGNTADDIDIHLFDFDDTGSLNIAYDYSINKYSDDDISKIHSRILHISNQILENSDILLKNIDIVTNEEKYEILYKWNETDANYPSSSTVTDLFEYQVNLTPNNTAISFNGNELTYDELNKKSNQLAHFLRTKGVLTGDIVALRLNKSLEMVISILAIIKAGACYLPIDLSYPQERVSFMLKDSNAKLFLTNNLHQNDLELSIPSILVDLSSKDIYSNTSTTENLNIPITPDNSIYIIYTSGSTGTPKGVELIHRNIVRLLKNDHFLFNFSDKDIWTMFHSCAFDFSVWEMYGALLYGGKLILVPEIIAKDPMEFLNLLRKEKVTILNQTPTYFYNLLDMEMLKSDNDLCIRYIIFGGEALNPKLIYNWKSKYPFTKLINMYGITETTVHVTFKDLTPENLLQTFSNIGTPIPTLKVYVMDKYQKLMPYGIEGEMCVAGLGLCKGYLNRPDLNNSRFVSNPYLPNERLYRSADSSILLDSGELIYKGRIDNQVKIRGFRIELGEIESKLCMYPSIEKCIVLPKIVDNKDAFLIAFLICNKPTTPSELKNYISKILPTYMIPTHFIFLDSFPLTNNGKVDRKKLLNINLSIKTSSLYVAPRNTFETVFANILEKILNIKKVGIDDNILELGADSLTLMKVTVELLQKNYIVNIQDIYELKTIRLIHEKISQEKKLHTILSNHLFYSFTEDFDSTQVNLNSVLITGTTGYLGIHILYELLKNYNCKIYCLVREKNNLEPKLRLIKKLNYYFGKESLSFIDNRIQIVDGDISLPQFGLSSKDYAELQGKIDTVIHSAALVSHYGNKELFDTINIKGTHEIINFCKPTNIKLNYISTTSVSGYQTCGECKNIDFDEHCLYVGQNYEDNIYIKTKFEAECSVWEALQNGLDICIYRLGNITARYTDGKFQDNDNQNAFLNRIVTFTKLGKIPDSFANLSIDLSPVDICSKVITNILKYKSSYGKVFHIYNNNCITVKELLSHITFLGKPIEIIPAKDFNSLICGLSSKEDALGIINDITSNLGKMDNNNIKLKCDFTINYITNLGLEWPIPNSVYIKKFLQKYIKDGV